VTEVDEVRAANDSFYAALEGLDAARMDEVWLHESTVRCIHPGADVIQGWESVRASWEACFSQTGWIRVTPTAVEVRLAGDLAFVVCAENITAQQDEDVHVAVALATNVYQRTPAGWRMIHHHASPAPMKVTQPFSGTVQ
jgi:uncharacterized protein (TIGR02246 family)